MKKAWSLLEEGEGEGEEGAEAEEDELITVTDVMEALGSGEAPLCIPSGFRAVTMAPSVALGQSFAPRSPKFRC